VHERQAIIVGKSPLESRVIARFVIGSSLRNKEYWILADFLPFNIQTVTSLVASISSPRWLIYKVVQRSMYNPMYNLEPSEQEEDDLAPMQLMQSDCFDDFISIDISLELHFFILCTKVRHSSA